MAVKNYDTSFDWCDELIEVRAYYSADECCNIIKNELRSLKGADEDFINDVCNRTNASFKPRLHFAPVYEATFPVTYTWEVESVEDKGDYKIDKTTSYTDRSTLVQTFYTGIYDSLDPSTFIGKKGDRFYTLKHVDDLNGGVYNASCVQTYNEIYSKADKIAARGKHFGKNSEYYINSLSATVFFVPMYVMNIEYGGTHYQCVVNAHNGHTHCKYLISERASKIALCAYIGSLVMRSATLTVGFWGFMQSLKVMNNDTTEWWGFLCWLLSIGLGIFYIVNWFTMRHNKQYFNDFCGAEGGVRPGAYGPEIRNLLLSVALLIITLILG